MEEFEIEHRNAEYPDTDAFMARARQIVMDHALTNGTHLTTQQVRIAWFSRTLQNWKALISTSLPDFRYYEVIHNGDRSETYLDVYDRVESTTIPL